MTGTGLFRLDKPHAEGLDPRVYAYYFKQWNGFHMPFHRHPSTEIMYAMSGTCRVEIEGKAGVTLKRSEFIVIGEDVPHRLLVEDSCRMLNVEFGFVPGAGAVSSIQAFGAEEPALDGLWSESAPYLVLKDPGDVHYALKSLVLELDGRGSEVSGMARILLAQLLIRMARLREETARSGVPAEDRYVRESLAFLQQNYDRDIQVRDVAAAVNLHPGYLQRIFKSVTGRTLVDTLTGIRIDKAKMLLKQTDIPVTDIYDYVGIGSRPYFHSLFKKRTGQTPMEYRKSVDAERWEYGDK